MLSAGCFHEDSKCGTKAVRILIVGGGEVGFHLARLLSQENHDVVMIEPVPEKCQRAMESLDVLVVEGNGASVATLDRAGIRETELLIAVTGVDEINIVCCLLAEKFGVPRKIARVRNPDYTSREPVLTPEELGIDLIINPEAETAEEIYWLIKRSTATDVLEFADGAIELVGIKLDRDAPVMNRTLMEVSQSVSDVRFRTVAIVRDGRTIIPTGNESLRRGDQIFVVAKRESVPDVLRLCGKGSERMERVMILGGGKIGRMVAALLEHEKGLDIRLIESRREKSQMIAEQLKRTMVIRGDGTDVDLLAAEGLIDMDGFIAVTEDEETNIITALLAKHLGVRRTIALIHRADYLPLMPAIGLDAAVDKRMITANAIARFVHRGEIVSIATLRGHDAVALELVARPGSKIVGRPLRKIKFPQGAIIGAVSRNGDVFVPVGDSVLRPNDKAVAFVLPSAVAAVEEMFV
jgi:trk system potassium uptake protein TrkA